MKNEITREEFKQLHSIACPDWKVKLEKMAIKSVFQDTISFDDEEIQLMVNACTKEQLPIVKSLFNITNSWENIKYDEDESIEEVYCYHIYQILD